MNAKIIRTVVMVLAVSGLFANALQAEIITSTQDAPQDRYLQQILPVIEGAEANEDSGEKKLALRKYKIAHEHLLKFHKDYPEWEPQLINARTVLCQERIKNIALEIAQTSGASFNQTVSTPITNTDGWHMLTVRDATIINANNSSGKLI